MKFKLQRKKRESQVWLEGEFISTGLIMSRGYMSDIWFMVFKVLFISNINCAHLLYAVTMSQPAWLMDHRCVLGVPLEGAKSRAMQFGSNRETRVDAIPPVPLVVLLTACYILCLSWVARHTCQAGGQLWPTLDTWLVSQLAETEFFSGLLNKKCVKFIILHLHSAQFIIVSTL